MLNERSIKMEDFESWIGQYVAVHRDREKKLILLTFALSELKAKERYIASMAPELNVRDVILTSVMEDAETIFCQVLIRKQ